MKKSITILFVVICMLFTACGTNTEQEDVAKGTASISIYAEHEDRYILEETEFTFSDGDSVFDLLQKATREKKIHMESSGTGEDGYVEGIDNIYTFDAGEMSGWLFYINGEEPQEGAGKIKLKDGDKTEWVFVKDWSKKE